MSAEAGGRRLPVHDGIVRVGVEDDVRHAAREMLVDDPLPVLEVLVKGEVKACQCLGAHAALAVDVRGGDTREDGLEVVGADEAVVVVRTPELTHRLVRILPVAEDVPDDHVAERRLVLGRHAVFVRESRDGPVVVLLDEPRAGVAPVEQELLRLRLAFQDIAEQRGEPRTQRVAVAFRELLFHLPGPGLRPAFPAVDECAVNLHAGGEDLSKIAFEVRLEAARIHLVALPARRLRRRGMVAALRVDVSEDERLRPDRLHGHRIRRHREMAQPPAGLRLPHVEAVFGRERPLDPPVSAMGTFHREGALPTLQEEARKRNRHANLVLPRAHRTLPHDDRLAARITAVPDHQLRVRLVGPVVIDLLGIRKRRREPSGVNGILNGEGHRADLVIVVIRIERRTLVRLEGDELAHRLVGRDPGSA